MAGGTSVDALRSTPGVEVDANDHVSLRGNSNVVVQINGRATPLNGDQLAQFLKDRGHHLTVETNTTIFPAAAVPLIDLWSLSPKLSSAGENYLRYPIIERFLEGLRSDQQQWKFVIQDDADEQALRALLTRYPAFAERRLPVILQPEGATATRDYPSALEELAKRVRDPFWDKYYVRVLPQMHVIIWGRRRWV